MWLAKMIETHIRNKNLNYNWSCRGMILEKDDVNKYVHNLSSDYPEIKNKSNKSPQLHSTGAITIMMVRKNFQIQEGGLIHQEKHVARTA